MKRLPILISTTTKWKHVRLTILKTVTMLRLQPIPSVVTSSTTPVSDLPRSHSTGCPFEPFGLCRGGLCSAVTFDTGLVDANIIGVNSETAHKFRRQTTCSPLNMDYPYVNKSSRGPNDTTYEDLYGSIYDEEGNKAKTQTYETSGNPFSWLAPYTH
jgi:hypothetical protein